MNRYVVEYGERGNKFVVLMDLMMEEMLVMKKD